MMQSYKHLLIAALSIILSTMLWAHDTAEHQQEGDSHADPYINLILQQVAFMDSRITSLAEAIPQDKYSWRPGEGVRSTSELLVHVISSGYFLSGMMGGEKPDNITQDIEKTLTEKGEILKELKNSFAAVTKFLKTYDTANFDKIVKTPFGEFSQRALILIINNHYHEHLGQLISYARINGVVPPWSAKEG